MAPVVQLRPQESAFHRIREVHDELVTAFMLTVDAFDEAQQRGDNLHVPNLKKAIGQQLREAHAAREWALLTIEGHELAEVEVREFLEANPDCAHLTMEEVEA